MKTWAAEVISPLVSVHAVGYWDIVASNGNPYHATCNALREVSPVARKLEEEIVSKASAV